MNVLRLIDDGRFSVKSVALASAQTTSVEALPAFRRTPKAPAPAIRVLPYHGPKATTSLYQAAMETHASGVWEDIVFAALAVCGVISVLLTILEAVRG
ncbi:MAG TPA: hypothetical protein VNZ64_20430 [Candidatus Acidoferrum sp.]|jgi:hypothetical protein|nr:hypothetical protein [Candidatus Acidoferrum sp.]